MGTAGKVQATRYKHGRCPRPALQAGALGGFPFEGPYPGVFWPRPKLLWLNLKCPGGGLPHAILGGSFNKECPGKYGASGVATWKDISSWHLSSGLNSNFIYAFAWC